MRLFAQFFKTWTTGEVDIHTVVASALLANKEKITIFKTAKLCRLHVCIHFRKGRKMEQRSDGLKSGLLKHGHQSLLREKVKHLQYFMKLLEIGTLQRKNA